MPTQPFILKPAEIEQIGSNLFHLPDIEQETQHLIEEARQRAQNLLNQAEVDSRQRKLQAEQEGFQKGYQEGYAKGKEEGYQTGQIEGRQTGEQRSSEELKPTISLLQNLNDELPQTWDQEIHRLKAHYLAFLQALSQKIIHQALDKRPEIISQTIETALSYLANAPSITIQLNETDYEKIQNLCTDFLERWSKKGALVIEKRPELPRGSCRLLTDKAEIDASFSTQVERLLQQLYPDKKD